MKPRLRLWLLLLLGFTLPLSGLAGLLPEEICPMQQQGMGMTSDIDCCQEHDSAQQDGKACKSGQQCKAGSLLQVAVLTPPILSASPAPFFHFAVLPPAGPRADIWRPPLS